MIANRLPSRLSREWLVALMSYSLLVAPFGCQLQLAPPDTEHEQPGDNLTAPATGFFLNSDRTEPLVAAGRTAAGDAFFVYGTRSAAGGIEEVQAIRVQTASGDESYMVFELGRPVYLRGPDGSYVHLEYTEVSADRLAALVTIYDATHSASNTAEVVIDLQQARADLAQAASRAAERIERLTGRAVEVPDAAVAANAKSAGRSLSAIIWALSIVPLVVLGQYAIVVVSSVLDDLVVAMGGAIVEVLLSAFTPLFLFTSLFGQAIVDVETLPLWTIFLHLPSMPHIDIEIG